MAHSRARSRAAIVNPPKSNLCWIFCWYQAKFQVELDMERLEKEWILKTYGITFKEAK